MTIPVKMLVNYRVADGSHFNAMGWQSNHALGILYLGNGFSSVMLLTGHVVDDGFPTLKSVHAFNEELLSEKKLVIGVCDLEELFSRSGGTDAAKAIVQKVKKRIMENHQ